MEKEVQYPKFLTQKGKKEEMLWEKGLQYPDFLTVEEKMKNLKKEKGISKLKLNKSIFRILFAFSIGALAGYSISKTPLNDVIVDIVEEGKRNHKREIETIIEASKEKDKAMELANQPTPEELEDNWYYNKYAEDHKDDMTVYPEDIVGRSK